MSSWTPRTSLSKTHLRNGEKLACHIFRKSLDILHLLSVTSQMELFPFKHICCFSNKLPYAHQNSSLLLVNLFLGKKWRYVVQFISNYENIQVILHVLYQNYHYSSNCIITTNTSKCYKCCTQHNFDRLTSFISLYQYLIQ